MTTKKIKEITYSSEFVNELESKTEYLKEENAELIQAISKIKRHGPNLDNSSHLNEEVADVLICIYELYVMGYLVTDKITEIIERKIERSIQRTQDHIKELEEEARCDGSF